MLQQILRNLWLFGYDLKLSQEMFEWRGFFEHGNDTCGFVRGRYVPLVKQVCGSTGRILLHGIFYYLHIIPEFLYETINNKGVGSTGQGICRHSPASESDSFLIQLLLQRAVCCLPNPKTRKLDINPFCLNVLLWFM
jgi:hypothetical protein